MKVLKRVTPLPWRVYQFSGSGEISWYGFAKKIFKQACNEGVLTSKPEIEAITTKEYPLPAPRPENSNLNTSRLEVWSGKKMPRWQVGMGRVINLVEARV